MPKLMLERRRPFSVLRGSCLANPEVMSRRIGSLSEVLRLPKRNVSISEARY